MAINTARVLLALDVNVEPGRDVQATVRSMMDRFVGVAVVSAEVLRVREAAADARLVVPRLGRPPRSPDDDLGKDPARVASGRLGGKARWDGRSAEQIRLDRNKRARERRARQAGRPVSPPHDRTTADPRAGRSGYIFTAEDRAKATEARRRRAAAEQTTSRPTREPSRPPGSYQAAVKTIAAILTRAGRQSAGKTDPLWGFERAGFVLTQLGRGQVELTWSTADERALDGMRESERVLQADGYRTVRSGGWDRPSSDMALLITR